MTKISRRQFLRLGLLALPAVAGVDAALIEPTCLRVTKLNLRDAASCRFVHFTDFHHKGNVRYAEEVIRTINDLAPEFVCFTGDLVEDRSFSAAALAFIKGIKCPVFGVPGNHDYWCHASFEEYERAFAATGGGWLVDRSFVIAKHNLELVGMALRGIHAISAPQAERRILMTHYPAFADTLEDRRFELILAGHSHGGQVRVPFYGALVVPWGVGRYDHGYFESRGGPLYVNAGIGTYWFPYRLNCRPEITVITI
jgi:predicted MPP superfamily phosphohydrolase